MVLATRFVCTTYTRKPAEEVKAAALIAPHVVRARKGHIVFASRVLLEYGFEPPFI